MRNPPAHILAAAKAAASQAPDFSPEVLAVAYRAIGVTPDFQSPQDSASQAAA
jgi:hypothetical protein